MADLRRLFGELMVIFIRLKSVESIHLQYVNRCYIRSEYVFNAILMVYCMNMVNGHHHM